MNDNKKNLWTILGVSNEAKDIAKEFSKKDKKTIGKWIELLIIKERNNNHQPLKIEWGDKPFNSIPEDENSFLSLHKKINDLTKQVAAISMQIYDFNKINQEINKKSFWSRFL